LDKNELLILSLQWKNVLKHHRFDQENILKAIPYFGLLPNDDLNENEKLLRKFYSSILTGNIVEALKDIEALISYLEEKS
jgi:hypothetical protein